MKKTILALGMIASAWLWMSCNNQPAAPATTTSEAAPAFDLASARKTIDSLNQAFGALAEKGDTTAIGASYTSDAKLMGPNGPAVQGNAGIVSNFAGMLKSGISKAELKTVDLWGTEALLSEEGTYTLSGKDGKALDKGKYIVLWKQEGGKWKMFRDIFNSDMAPAPTK